MLLHIQQQMVSLDDLKRTIAGMGMPAYRAAQIYSAVCREGKEDILSVTTLPLADRKLLSARVAVYSILPVKVTGSSAGDTRKILFRLKDGYAIETVIMSFADGRNSVCVSSQAGCRLGCRFCATGAAGFFRDLDYEEIFDQVLYAAHQLRRKRLKISNVVYMGMGEPFFNYENVIRSVRCLNDPSGLNIGARNITLSTSGVCEGIEALAKEELQVNLAVSLHAPNQGLREKLMPVARLYGLDKLMDSIKRYITLTRRRVTYEYVMLKGINDGAKQAKELASLLKGQLCHINLIPYNATGIRGIGGSAAAEIRSFRDIIKASGIPVTIRVSLGRDINAACGQLSAKTQYKTPKSPAI